MASHSATSHHGSGPRAAQEGEFFREHGWREIPRLVQWMTTCRCPLACPHCLSGDDFAGDMPLPQAERLIEQVAEMGVEEFLLTGGEPFARNDFSQIVGVLHANRVRWSLNTAQMPDRRTPAAIEKWPPGFIAVSLDGPEEIHDGFRGRRGSFRQALKSIGYFAGLGGGVAAGTTVTTRNYEALATTLGIVVESGATSWGLHLTVPEGRASIRKDLLLSRSQIKGLLRFVASKRNYFPVTMADEIGYCGYWEPLLRDSPFFCGAGRAGCVVLPDGEVVPCTTLDRTTSAGNVATRSLREIWETGFGNLRRWSPENSCKACPYVSACGGGCWLQRRHGTQCFQESWHVPQALKTAAGLAICLGISSAAWSAHAQEAVPVAKASTDDREETLESHPLEREIVLWYAHEVRTDLRQAPSTRTSTETPQREQPDDPATKYFHAFKAGQRPAGIEDRAKAIVSALKTRQRSLSLVALAWRDVIEWCLDHPRPEQRSLAERKALQEVMSKIGQTAETWRTEIFKSKLENMLRYRNWGEPAFLRSKAMPRPEQMMEWKLAVKRWRGGVDATHQFLADHPHAEGLSLKCRVRGGMLRCQRGGQTIEINPFFTLQAFDILLVPKPTDESIVLFISAGNREVAAVLPPECDLTYGDVLRLVDEQNRKFFETKDIVSELARFGTLPLALPELHRRIEARKASTEEANQKDPFDRRETEQLLDIYLF